MSGWKQGVAAAIIGLGATGHMVMSETAFDSEQWKAQRGSMQDRNPRMEMLPKLMPLLRVGMSKDEVVALLGPTESTRKESTVIYDLGAASYGVHYEHLEILIGPDDRVVSVKQVRG
jgi:hypothetical protein